MIHKGALFAYALKTLTWHDYDKNTYLNKCYNNHVGRAFQVQFTVFMTISQTNISIKPHVYYNGKE